MKLFTYAITGYKRTNSLTSTEVRFEFNAGAILRSSKEEAIGAAYLTALENYPISEGYSNHGTSVCEVPMEMIEQVYRNNIPLAEIEGEANGQV